MCKRDARSALAELGAEAAERGGDRVLLTRRCRRHRGAREAGVAALERLRGLGAGGQVVADHDVPERQQAAVEVEGALVVAGLDGVPKLHARVRRRRQDCRDRAVSAQREARIEQRVDRAQDQVVGVPFLR